MKLIFARVPRVFPAALELVIVGSLFLLYNWGRIAIRDQERLALLHAEQVHRLESAIGLPCEAWLQGIVANVPHIFEFANRYYTSVHFPLTLLFLLWGFTMRPREEYVWARHLLVVQTFLALPRGQRCRGQSVCCHTKPSHRLGGAYCRRDHQDRTKIAGWPCLAPCGGDRLRRGGHRKPLVARRCRRRGAARRRIGAVPSPGW